MIRLDLTDAEFAALRTLTEPHRRNLAGVSLGIGGGTFGHEEGPTLLRMDLKHLAEKVEQARPVALARCS